MIAEITVKLEEERNKLQQLQAENKVKVAAARVRAYNNCNRLEGFKDEEDDKSQPYSQIIESLNPLIPQAKNHFNLNVHHLRFCESRRRSA